MAENDKLANSVGAALEGARSPEGARNILALLFPKVARVIRAYVPGDQSSPSERKRGLRASSREFINVYFGLDPKKVFWTAQELEWLLNGDPRLFFNEVLYRIKVAPELDQPRLRRLFLEILDGAFGEHRPFNEAWMKTLMEMSTYFLSKKDELAPILFTIDNEDRLRWILVSAFEPLPVDRRAEILEIAIGEAEDLSLLCEFVRSVTGDKNSKGSQAQYSRASLEDRAEKIRSQLLWRVRIFADDGRIWWQVRLDSILWFWWGAGDEGEVRRFADSQLSEPRAVLRLMDVCVNTVRSTGGDYERVARSWSEIVDLERLGAIAKEYLDQTVPEETRALAVRFLQALEKGRNSSF